MTKSKQAAADAARDEARGYTDADLAAVSDNPEWTEEELRTAQPLDAFAPELAAAIKRGRGKQKAPTKVAVNLRVDRAVLDHFKSGGPGWQVRMNDALKKSAGV